MKSQLSWKIEIIALYNIPIGLQLYRLLNWSISHVAWAFHWGVANDVRVYPNKIYRT